MKIRILSICSSVLAIWILLLPRRAKGQPDPANPPVAGIHHLTAAESNAVNQRVLTLWQAPIEFYGKVVDENSNPVAGATINFHWVESPSEDGNRTTNTESNAEGLFSLRGARGPDLAVLAGKEGYFSSREKDHPAFKYGLFANTNFSPDSQNPVVFHLHKKGKEEPSIKKGFPPGMGQIWQLRHDGLPVELDLLKGTKVPAGNGQLKLELWRDVSDLKAARFDWKLQLSISNGGLVGTDEEFAFHAPERGYQPSIAIDMPATNKNWKGEIQNKYYVQLPGGKCGTIDLYLLPYNGVFRVRSAINPSGSRNLEFDR